MSDSIHLNVTASSSKPENFKQKLSQGVGHQVALLHGKKADEEKEKIDRKSAEVIQRENKKTFISSIMSDLNVLTDELNQLDISNNPDLLEKIRVAREELDVQLPESKTKFNALERDRILQILDLKKQEYEIKNKQDMLNIDAWIKATYQFLELSLDTLKKTDRTIGTVTQAYRS